MVLEAPRQPLRPTDLPDPVLQAGQLRLRVQACAVCRTDLHVVDGELTRPKLPLVPGHEIVGTVVELAADVSGFALGDRVGVPWLAWTCGRCRYCLAGRENLCDAARFTGYQVDGGYAERCVAEARFCFHLPLGYDPVEAAPLLCAGLIGHRALSMTGGARRVGIYGFGAAAHLVTQEARAEGRTIFAFTRPGDTAAMQFARDLGAAWAGGSDERAPDELDGAILFAPVGALVPLALAQVIKGGVVVCGGIHMSDIPAFPYSLLWGERMVRSVANLTRQDALEFFSLASRVRFSVRVTSFALEQANEALNALRRGRLTGTAVLTLALPSHVR
jgi:propanol-preferring alcohol dehydrogenase